MQHIEIHLIVFGNATNLGYVVEPVLICFARLQIPKTLLKAINDEVQRHPFILKIERLTKVLVIYKFLATIVDKGARSEESQAKLSQYILREPIVVEDAIGNGMLVVRNLMLLRQRLFQVCLFKCYSFIFV